MFWLFLQYHLLFFTLLFIFMGLVFNLYLYHFPIDWFLYWILYLVFICCNLLLDFHILITLLGLLLLSDKIFGWVIFIKKLYSFLCPYQTCFFLFFFRLFCNYYSCTFYFFIKVFITLCTACNFLTALFSLR